jgi:hypothetical protein
VRRAYHAAEGNVMDVQGLTDLFADDDVINLGTPTKSMAEPARAIGTSNLPSFLLGYSKPFPDVHRELHRVNVRGDVVAVELSIRSTFLGPLQTPGRIFQPTGARAGADRGLLVLTRREDREIRLLHHVPHDVGPNGRELPLGAVFSVCLVLASGDTPLLAAWIQPDQSRQSEEPGNGGGNCNSR